MKETYIHNRFTKERHRQGSAKQLYFGLNASFYLHKPKGSSIARPSLVLNHFGFNVLLLQRHNFGFSRCRNTGCSPKKSKSVYVRCLPTLTNSTLECQRCSFYDYGFLWLGVASRVLVTTLTIVLLQHTATIVLAPLCVLIPVAGAVWELTGTCFGRYDAYF
jgi:hypothetical protein